MLSDNQRQKVAQLAADYIGGDAEDYVDDIVATREPIENFIAIAENFERDDDCGDGYILHRVQCQKGETRTTIEAIDFGDVRGLYES